MSSCPACTRTARSQGTLRGPLPSAARMRVPFDAARGIDAARARRRRSVWPGNIRSAGQAPGACRCSVTAIGRAARRRRRRRAWTPCGTRADARYVGSACDEAVRARTGRAGCATDDGRPDPCAGWASPCTATGLRFRYSHGGRPPVAGRCAAHSHWTARWPDGRRHGRHCRQPLGQSDVAPAIRAAVRRRARPVGDTAAAAAADDGTRFDGRFRLPEMLAWIECAIPIRRCRRCRPASSRG